MSGLRKYVEAKYRGAELPAAHPEPEGSPLVVAPVVGQWSGWLSPIGEFYPCQSWEHESFAWRLAEKYGYRDFYSGSKALEENEWVKLKSGDWIVVAREFLTQKQLDAVWDWLQDRGKSFEDACIY